MELLTKLLIVLLMCTRLNADSIADEGSLMSIESYEEKLKENEAAIQLLENEISEIDKRITPNYVIRQQSEKSYFTGVLRSALLGIYPTLCLPDGKNKGTRTIDLCDGPFEVGCEGEIAGPGWIVIQRRINDNLDFNRNWNEYENGFGNITGSYFIGLKKLLQLTSLEPHELFIYLESLDGETRFANYNHFEIMRRNYKLKSVGQYSGTAGNAFEDSVGNNFKANSSRKFRDSTNLITGWWSSYDQSGIGSNLNAAYSQWQTWPKPFKTVQMLIRPKMKSDLMNCEPISESFVTKATKIFRNLGLWK